MDLNLSECTSLPFTALQPLATLIGLEVLNIRGHDTSDLAPLSSCLRLRRLYIQTRCGVLPLDLSPLSGLAKLQVIH